MTTFWVWLSAVLISATPSATPVPQGINNGAVDTLVICPEPLLPGLTEWTAYRQQQGHRLAVVTRCDSPADIRRAVHDAAQGANLRFVVMVGDVQTDPALRDVNLPTDLVVAQVNQRWGSEKQIATDNPFADLDRDGVPELAIGRIPASSVQEVRDILGKSLAYEQSAHLGTWRRRVNIVAGVGGFGLLTDAVLETATRSILQSGIPEAYQTTMTYASWRSPYCPDPRDFRGQVVQRINEGCLCWVYIGHGQREGLDWIRVPAGVAPILDGRDVHRLNCRAMPPIAVFLSCYGAAFDGPQDSMAERMVRSPRGPVAAAGGTRVTMPYGMAILAQGLMKELFTQQPQTLGEVLLAAKRQAVSREPQDQHAWLDAVAKVLSPNADDLITERHEHLQLFHLLGDPLLRLHHPQTVNVTAPARVQVGEEISLVCDSPVSGECLIELTSRRGQLTFKPAPRHTFDASDAGMLALTDVYQKANDGRYASQTATVPRQFRTKLRVPEAARGSCAIRVYVQGAGAYAMGAALLTVAAPPSTETNADVVAGDAAQNETAAEATTADLLAVPAKQD